MQRSFAPVSRGVVVAAIALLGVLTTGAPAPARVGAECAPASSWGKNRPDLATQVVDLVNQHRAAKGLPQLSLSGPLTASSQWKSLHMAANGYFSHDDPAPPAARTAFQRAKDCGYGGGTWGENIAFGYATAQSVVDGWLGSSGHRANIENARYTSTGVGVAANAAGRLYWTQSFGDDASAAPTPPNAPPSPPSAPPSANAPPPAPKAPGASASSPSPVKEREIGAKAASVTRSTTGRRIAASVPFVYLKTGAAVTAGSVRCRAEVDGKRLPVVANGFRSNTARCVWRVPGWAVGEQLTGVVALQTNGTAAVRLFMRRLS